MANPMWIVGGKSPNPGGRPKIVSSVRTIKGMVERFVKKNITPNRLQKMFNGLKESQQLEMLLQLLPYVIPRVQADRLTNEEIEQLYSRLEEKIKSNVETKAKAV